MDSFQSFAIVPAAGYSTRMGTAKLLLPWNGRTLIEHLLLAWQQSEVDRIVVVARADDRPLLELARRADVDLVLPTTPPPEMKDSVCAALVHVRDVYQPTDHDAWLLAPADLPRLNPRVINQVLHAYQQSSAKIVLPSHAQRRGHPVLFAWALHAHVFSLKANEGVNALLSRFPVQDVVTEDELSWKDVDHPTDYRRLQSESPPPDTERSANDQE